MFPKIVGFPPKSSVLIGCSSIFTIHFGGFPPFLGNTHISIYHNPPPLKNCLLACWLLPSRPFSSPKKFVPRPIASVRVSLDKSGRADLRIKGDRISGLFSPQYISHEWRIGMLLTRIPTIDPNFLGHSSCFAMVIGVPSFKFFGDFMSHMQWDLVAKISPQMLWRQITKESDMALGVFGTFWGILGLGKRWQRMDCNWKISQPIGKSVIDHRLKGAFC